MLPGPLSALDRARRKAYRRLLPLVFVSYVIAYVDRSNVGYAKLTMARDLGFDNAVFGLGAGMFFVGYFLLEIPGALIVERWSARKWISRIMISWGIVAALMASVRTPSQFYAMRFLLGLAEAGFFPGVIVYLTHWFPARDRARALAYFIIAAPVAQMIGPPLAGPLLRHQELWGLAGWQWVYILWGLPAVVLGVVVLFAMTDRPAHARWLTSEERQALEQELAREQAGGRSGGHGRREIWRALADPRVLLLAAANFSVVIGHYGIELFLPSILERWYGLGPAAVGWFLVPPFAAMLAGQLLVSWSSDRSGERWWHTALPMFFGGAALALTPLSQGRLGLTLLLFALALAGIRSYLPPFYALPRLFLQGSAAAGAIGLINAIGNLGGFVGPSVVGKMEKVTGSFEGGLYFLCAAIALAGVFILILRAISGAARPGSR